MTAEATFFASAADFRRWLEANHTTATELIVGFHHKASGRGGLTYAEAVDEALCFGWIDGIIRKLDTASYCHRFTPRKPDSIWSKINVGHVKRLAEAGRMRPAGIAAFERRSRTGVYSFENRPQDFPPAFAKRFRAEAPAWKFWSAQPPGYRRTAIWWVISAKREETRDRRLARLMADSAAGRRLPQLS